MFEMLLECQQGSGFIENPEKYNFIRQNRARNPMILVASASRSGSSYLANMVKDICDLNWFRLTAAYFNTENDLYVPALCIADRFRTISLLHIKATSHSSAFINLFGIKTIITTRNIFETIASCARYIRRRKTHPNFKQGYASASMAWIDLNQAKLSDDELLDFVIDMYLPWYINFYVSWYSVTKRGEIDALWVSREELKQDTKGTLSKILDYCQLDSKIASWDEIINAYPAESFEQYQDTSHNLTTKDWQDKLTKAQIERVYNYTSYYPNVDFSRIFPQT